MLIDNRLGLSDREILLSTEEVSQMVHLTPKTLRTYRCGGARGPRFIKVGKRALYRLSDVREYIASGGKPQIGGGK